MAARRGIVMQWRVTVAGVLAAGLVLASCGSSGSSDSAPDEPQSEASPVRTTDVGVEVGPDAEVSEGAVVVAGGSAQAATPFASFTPIAAAGWGADEAGAAFAYRPDPDGLPFPNAAPPEPFGVDDAIALFGDRAVCVEASGPCTPTAPAQAWIDIVAAATAGGVCEGMVVFSLDRFVVAAQPPTYQLPLDTETNDRILRLFATQFLPDVQQAAAATRGKDLGEVVSLIENGLANGAAPYTIGIYGPTGGHSLVPYAVRRFTESQVTVYVYDPNWPGLDRYIEFDLALGTWRYSMRTANAADDPSPWFGTGDQIDLVALVEREAPFIEPFAGAGTGEGRALLMITTRSRDWSITSGEESITADTATPGVGSVVAVSRGASSSGVGTYVVTVEDGAVIDGGDDAVDVSVVDEGRVLRGVSPQGGARYSFHSGDTGTSDDTRGPALRQVRGGGVLTAYVAGGVVQAPGGVGTEIGIDGATVSVVGEDGASRSVDVPDDGRTDFRFRSEGAAAEVPVVPADEGVRSADGARLLLGIDGDPEPTTVGPTTTVSPRPSSTTTSTSMPPPNPNQVEVVVQFATTAPGVVSLEVRKLGTSTLDFTVRVAGPGVQILSGVTYKWAETLQGLSVGSNYVITVTFTDGTKTVRNFTVPGQQITQ